MIGSVSLALGLDLELRIALGPLPSARSRARASARGGLSALCWSPPVCTRDLLLKRAAARATCRGLSLAGRLGWPVLPAICRRGLGRRRASHFCGVFCSFRCLFLAPFVRCYVRVRRCLVRLLGAQQLQEADASVFIQQFSQLFIPKICRNPIDDQHTARLYFPLELCRWHRTSSILSWILLASSFRTSGFTVVARLVAAPFWSQRVDALHDADSLLASVDTDNEEALAPSKALVRPIFESCHWCCHLLDEVWVVGDQVKDEERVFRPEHRPISD
mmetsp:Transcript_85322/g.198365  ORF Transcript_85322/g.198365 Transcript_85322/m.198365 type:complete len:275 (+) Transcript_85322:756-1580(+)